LAQDSDDSGSDERYSKDEDEKDCKVRDDQDDTAAQRVRRKRARRHSHGVANVHAKGAAPDPEP
jgi:hypothetical protein